MEHLSDEYKIALCDIEEIINSLDQNLQNKIPQQFKEFVRECKMPNCKSTFNPQIPIQQQKLSKQTASILAIIQYNYLCTTEEEKTNFLNLFK